MGALGYRVVGDCVHLGRCPRGRGAQEVGEALGVGHGIVDPVQEHVLEGHGTAGGARRQWAAATISATGQSPEVGTRRWRSSSSAACRLTARPTGRASRARRSMPDTRPTMLTVMRRAPKPSRSHKDGEGAAQGRVVGQRLAHAHEHQVGERAELALHDGRLVEYLAGGGVVHHAADAGGAEYAAHGAAHLAADANGCGARGAGRTAAAPGSTPPPPCGRRRPAAKSFVVSPSRERDAAALGEAVGSEVALQAFAQVLPGVAPSR